jgi:uncharacterized protein
MNIDKILSDKCNLSLQSVKCICDMLEAGATIPFIARYRKDMTGGATDEQLRKFNEQYLYLQKLEHRKEEVSRLITEKGLLTEKIKINLNDAETLSQVEDIYRPYKEKKHTRAGIAHNQGLTVLADMLQKNNLSLTQFRVEAEAFVKKEIKSVDEAIKGAQDILAERYSDDSKERDMLRNSMRRFGMIETKATKTFDVSGTYKRYQASAESVSKIPSHRYMALRRGVKEKQLTVKITMDVNRLEENIKRYKIPRHANNSDILFDAYKDGLKRLLYPSIEREVFSEIKVKAETQAINVFGQNLFQLLMTPPTPKKAILGVDPGFKTGCKLAVIDHNGKYLANDVIYPVPPRNDFDSARQVVEALCGKFKVEAVAIGNGTASRESQDFFAEMNQKYQLNVPFTVVSEAGASVYSASLLAHQEYPDLDVTVRGAISIAQRLLDPMAALVKIDPKSIGVGQYQHDVDQKRLNIKLDETIERVVNQVGVDVNTASPSLLSHVAGVGSKLAAEIVVYRDEKDAFKKRADLLKVKGLGAKAFQQCSGFLRIRDGVELLDNTGVHPEHYKVAKAIQESSKIQDMTPEKLSVFIQEYDLGRATLKDIQVELEKPGFDPRTELPKVVFRNDVLSIDDLSEGMIVSGVVRNIVDFGAFVDIGLKNDGLIHISEISVKRIDHPMDVMSINLYLSKIKVISIDKDKNKVGLSLLV